jgi:hypothetical protein
MKMPIYNPIKLGGTSLTLVENAGAEWNCHPPAETSRNPETASQPFLYHHEVI